MNHVMSVVLTANTTSFSSAMARAAGQTKTFSQSIEGTAKTSSTAWSQVGKGAVVAGGLIAAGLGVAIKAAAAFEVKMSALQAVTGSSADSLLRLRDQAIAMGAATSFSAGEAAQAQIELAKAGVATSDILGGALQGALALAAAGELEVAEAATIASQAMVTFGLAGRDVPAIADALAAGANKSAAEVGDLSAGLSQSGLVASQFGLSMEETVGTLSAFSAAGLQGSDAGTSLKTMLMRLGAPTSKASELMGQLGISVYDAQGAMLPFGQIAESIQNSLAGLSDQQRNAALSTLFGSDAIRAANVVFREGGEGIAEWTSSVSEQGYAADLAATKTDNLMGDVERLGGSFETLLIQLGESGQGPARAAVQFLTGLTDAVSGLPDPVMQAGVAIGALAAGALVLGGVAPKLVAANAALSAMGPAGATAATGISLMSRAVQGAALAAPIILGFNYAIEKMFGTAASAEELEDLAGQLDRFGGATERARGIMLGGDLGGEFDKLAAAIGRVTEPSNLQRLADIGGEITSLGGVLSQTGSDLSDAHQDIEDFNNALIELVETDPRGAGEAYAAALRMMIDAGVPARDAMEQLGESRAAVFEARLPGDAGASEIQNVGDAAAEAEQEVEAFAAELEALFSTRFGAAAAADDIQQAINDLTAGMLENGGAIRGNTNEALANRDALMSVASAQFDYVSALAEGGATQDEITLATAASVDQLNVLAERFPQLRPLVDEYVAGLMAIPTEVNTAVNADGSQAAAEIAEAASQRDAWNDSRGIATIDANNDSARVRIQSSRDGLHSWGNSSGTADILGDNTQFGASRDWAATGLSSFDRSSGTADLNARDNASGTISKVARNLSALDGRTATVTVTHREIRQQITEVGQRPLRMPRRWGGVHEVYGEAMTFAAAAGMAWEAHVATQPTIYAGERQTGGEAMIPRLGNYDRSMGILNHAAGWYDAAVVPNGAAGRIGQPQLAGVGASGGPVAARSAGVVDNSTNITMPVEVNVNVTAGDVIDGGQQLARRIESGVNNGVNAALREMIRQQRKRPHR